MSDPHYYSAPATPPTHRLIETELCIYGGTSGGIIAAVQARRLGRRVALLVFGTHLGGMSASGLGLTDIGNKAAIGGLSREFYREVGRHYGLDAESWNFEPKAASAVFRRLLEEANVPVYFEQRIISATKDGNRLTEIAMEDGSLYRAAMFIDASYEGDLLAKAGVSYHTGREGNATYGEVYNGVHYSSPHHNFKRFVDPFKIAGDPCSGLLPGISDTPVPLHGAGDHRIQAYNFRLCLTKSEGNKRPLPAPKCYDPEEYTLLARYLATGVWDAVSRNAPLPNGKTDTNNYGAFSTDAIGMNYRWPEGSYAERQEIFERHLDYTRGLFWFLQHDERVPKHVRDEVREWGLPLDEFLATGGWPPELYIREARRMISDYVMTEHDCIGQATAPDPVGLAAYTMDSHNCQRIVINGRVLNEGNVEIGGFEPYPISYRSIVPKEEECANLLVPFCLSASHIAFGSIRMEPVFMVLSHSAATAAHLAMKGGLPVQQLPYPVLQRALLAEAQTLRWQSHT